MQKWKLGKSGLEVSALGFGAANVELSESDLRDITAAVSKISVQGDRYPAHLQQRVNR